MDKEACKTRLRRQLEPGLWTPEPYALRVRVAGFPALARLGARDVPQGHADLPRVSACCWWNDCTVKVTWLLPLWGGVELPGASRKEPVSGARTRL
eukprot:scaffold389_cov382-Prasinococcus_capsulatus_cf.AAC.34